MKIIDQYDYHKFLKIKRKYYKRHCVKRVDHIYGKRFVSYWEKEDWIGYIVPSFYTYSLDKSVSKEIKYLIGPDLYNNRLEAVKLLYNEIWKEFRSYYNYKDNNYVEYGYFLGVIITNRDAYFLVSNVKYSKDKKDYKLIPMFWNFEKYLFYNKFEENKL